MTYKHEFTIVEDRWLHAGPDGEMPWDKDHEDRIGSALRIPDGRMCCLGFFALSCGLKVSDIRNVTTPKYTKAEPKHDIFNVMKDRSSVDRLIDANDANRLTLAKRKQKIKEIFAEEGIKVNFVRTRKKNG